MSKVYEVRDCTSDEMYFTIALFFDIKEAIQAVNNESDKDSAISEFADQYEHIKIFEIVTGWEKYNPKEVYSIEREYLYDPESDDLKWQEISQEDKQA